MTTEDTGGWTAAVKGVRAAQWAAVEMMLAAGADPEHVVKSGLSLASALELRLQRARAAGEPIAPELLALDARLRARPGTPH